MPPDNKHQALLAKKVRLIYTATIPGIIANLSVGTLIGFSLSGRIETLTLLGLLGFLLMTVTLRYVNYRDWINKQPEPNNPNAHDVYQPAYWATRYTATMLLNGSAWAMLAWFSIDINHTETVTLMSFVVLGVATAVLAVSALRRIAFAFGAPPLLTLALALGLKDFEHAQLWALLVLTYTAYLALMTHNTAKNIHDSLAAQFDNQTLRSDIEQATDQEQQTVAQLEHEIEQHLYSQQRLTRLGTILEQQNRAATRVESLFAALSQQLFFSDHGDLTPRIEAALASIGNVFDLDCIGLCGAQANNKSDMTLHYRWAIESHSQVFPEAGQSLSQDLPWLGETLLGHRTKAIANVADLSDKAPEDFQLFAQVGLKSLLILPLGSHSSANQGICLATQRRFEPWSADTIRRLKTLGELLSNAIERDANRHALQHSQHLLEHTQRNTMMGELSASLAHELNQPLTAIANNAQYLLSLSEKLSDPELNPVRQEIEDASNDCVRDALRAGDVIRRIRAMNRPNKINRSALDCNQLIAQVLELIHSETIIRRCRIYTHLDPTLPPISGDIIALQQVLINLLMNGMEAAAHSTKAAHPDWVNEINIHSLLLDDEHVGIRICDNGPGLPSESLERIFDAFHTSKKDGMGMGLAIVRGIVEAHSGHIRAENSIDGGACFELALPIHSTQPKDGAA